MSYPRSAQEWVHWIEIGAGSRPIWRAAALVGLLALSLVVANKQYHGPAHEMTLLQADVGRQLAAGRGFSTLVSYPQTAALMEARHRVLPADTEYYPELHHAPLYSLLIGGALRVLPVAWREALFASPPTPPDGFAADYFLLGLNLVLFWLAAWQTFLLGRQLFDGRVGWVAMLALMLSVGVWNQVVLVNGLPLLMLLALIAFRLLAATETSLGAEPGETTPPGRVDFLLLLALGGVGGLLFLAEYSAGLLLLVAMAYVSWRICGGPRWVALAVLLAGFALPAVPWAVRNVVLTGNPVGLAWQNIALKAGDSTAEPSVQRTLFTAEPPKLELNKLGNKGLTGVQLNVKDRLWSGGGYFVVAFFVAGWLYQFRDSTANRMRWVFTSVLLVLIVGQSFLSSGESQRLPVYYLLPPLLVFGAGFFFVLVESNSVLGAHSSLAAAALLILQSAPLAHDLLEPRGLHFHYPPYYPALFMRLHSEMERRGGLRLADVMADVPAGYAWYGRQRVWAQPDRIKDFYLIMIERPISLLVLTPETLDRPFFGQLAVNGVSAEARSQKYEGWGPVYAGLVTGRMPPEFPLRPQKMADNLIILLNPVILPRR